MTLVDIKSNLTSAFVVNLPRRFFGKYPQLRGTIHRGRRLERDPVSGEDRVKEYVQHCPPTITIPPKGVARGLPAEVLEVTAIKCALQRAAGRKPNLRVVREYEPEPVQVAKAAPAPLVIQSEPLSELRTGPPKTASNKKRKKQAPEG